MQVFNEPVPVCKFQQFHDILCATGGRYINNPEFFKDTVRVSYTPGDYKEQYIRWNMITSNVTEIRKDQLWRCFIRRLRFW